MPSHDVARSEAQGAQTMRTAIIAGAIGSVAGAIVVMATVATVLSFVNSSPVEKETAAAPKPAPAAVAPAPVVAAPPPAADKPSPTFNRLAESPAGKEGCEDQTWPNIETRCLTRVDNPPRETTGGPTAKPPVTAAPAELRPGSPVLPNPSVLYESRSVATTPTPTAPPQASAPQPAPQAVQVNVNGQPHMVPQETTLPSKPPKAATTKPTRRTADRSRPPKNARPIDDDDDDRTSTVTIYRDRGTVYHDRGTTRQVIEEVVEPPTVRYRPSAFGSIFRGDD